MIIIKMHSSFCITQSRRYRFVSSRIRESWEMKRCFWPKHKETYFNHINLCLAYPLKNLLNNFFLILNTRSLSAPDITRVISGWIWRSTEYNIRELAVRLWSFQWGNYTTFDQFIMMVSGHRLSQNLAIWVSLIINEKQLYKVVGHSESWHL